MASRPRSKKKSVKVGPRIVRAWFDTVINPLLSSLKVEKEYLEKRDWTWQFRPERLESLRPIQNMLSFEAVDNLEQFLDFYPYLNEIISDYEDKREKLFANCKELHQVLKKSPQFLDVFQKATTEESISEFNMGSLGNIFRGYPPELYPDVLAQYTVNNQGELPFHLLTWRLWEKYRDEFLAVLESNDARIQNRKTIKAGQALLRPVEQLIDQLKEIREELSLEHDMPYVSATPIFAE
ncbi:MAG TPA: hypothetical protein VEX60_18655 [Pyrinomonadaceae bacterium]|nr:hypothetical protein [Pyrinomonadaceae bacterium]